MDWWSSARRVAVLLMCLVWASSEATPQQQGQPAPWWNHQFGYRVKVTVNSGYYKRKDYLVRVPLSDLKLPGQSPTIDSQPLHEESLRVVEWNSAMKSARELPSQIGVGRGGVRALCWQMTGETATLTDKSYFLYFGKTPALPRPDYPPLLGADKPPPENVVLNPSFEEAKGQNPSMPSHWKVTGNDVGEVVRTDEFAHSGRFSVKITNQKGGLTSVGLGQQVEGVKSGASYLLRGWVKVTEQQNGGAGVTVWYTPAPGQKLPGNNKTQAGGGGVADWVQLVATGVIYHDPDRGASIVVDTTLPGTAGGWVEASCWYGVLTAYFDDLELIERDRDAFAPCFVIVGEMETRPVERRATLILEEGLGGRNPSPELSHWPSRPTARSFPPPRYSWIFRERRVLQSLLSNATTMGTLWAITTERNPSPSPSIRLEQDSRRDRSRRAGDCERKDDRRDDGDPVRKGNVRPR